MIAMATTQPNLGVIMEKIENIRGDVVDIKTMLSCHIEAQQKFEQETNTSRALLSEKVGQLQTDVGDHEGRIGKLEDIVKRLAVTDAILRWVAVAFMSSLIALIWALLTDQVHLTF